MVVWGGLTIALKTREATTVRSPSPANRGSLDAALKTRAAKNTLNKFNKYIKKEEIRVLSLKATLNPGQPKPTNLTVFSLVKESESESEVAQSCPTLCDTTGCSLPGSSVHGILQARILEWVAISFSRGSSWPRDWTLVSLIAGRHLTSEPPGKALSLVKPPTNMHCVWFPSYKKVLLCVRP